jgi:hypothetical protein
MTDWKEGKGCAPLIISGSEPSILFTMIKEGVSINPWELAS